MFAIMALAALGFLGLVFRLNATGDDKRRE
jgi:hypothetical protein